MKNVIYFLSVSHYGSVALSVVLAVKVHSVLPCDTCGLFLLLYEIFKYFWLYLIEHKLSLLPMAIAL